MLLCLARPHKFFRSAQVVILHWAVNPLLKSILHYLDALVVAAQPYAAYCFLTDEIIGH